MQFGSYNGQIKAGNSLTFKLGLEQALLYHRKLKRSVSKKSRKSQEVMVHRWGAEDENIQS